MGKFEKINQFTQVLREDAEFRKAYKQSMVSSFTNEWYRALPMYRTQRVYAQDIDIEAIANEAAEKFIENWCLTHE